MKKLLILMILLPIMAYAQRSEIGVLGGMKSDGGWAASAACYFKFLNFQVGPVVEFSSVETGYVFANFATGSYNAISPGINFNYLFTMPRGYVYPGITARYRIGAGALDYRGLDYGLQLGVVLKLVKSLFANAETGFRIDNISGYNLTGDKLGATSTVTVPIMLGLRVAL